MVGGREEQSPSLLDNASTGVNVHGAQTLNNDLGKPRALWIAGDYLAGEKFDFTHGKIGVALSAVWGMGPKPHPPDDIASNRCP